MAKNKIQIIILVRGITSISTPSRTHSWLMPSSPELFFFFISFIAFFTFVSVTSLNPKWRFFDLTFSRSLSSGSSILLLSIFSFRSTIFSLKYPLKMSAISASSVIILSPSLSVHFLSSLGFVMSLTIFHTSSSLLALLILSP